MHKAYRVRLWSVPLDAHGNVTGILDSNYDISQSYTYDPFGADIVSAAESEIRDDEMQSLIPSAGIMSSGIQIGYIPENPYRYCGEYTDTETGYVYLRARYYDPTIGRFISEDSAKDGYNWYVYCGNDPVNYVDPSGHFILASFALFLGIAAVASLAIVTATLSITINSNYKHNLELDLEDSQYSNSLVLDQNDGRILDYEYGWHNME